ncbi:DUF397 domain-containing protein [Streptomyces sp. NBC_00006]|uniref:DUF397 domain-containing protein n=1 Tax=unclassified Streptomyces TaxID=2593676 RepID=UPI002256C3C4|nr:MULTISPECIES: DUF397 domain-containing protein [unclassified Streptomyces]MCX4834063.1 DUF397 domain-containing protein [Streptomyces sp. NBC_01016]MCX5535043.1 DUF397 domain-containing protein [Streptomyces sp. NBC_00006]
MAIARSTSLSGVRWRRSSRSTGANNCVETASLRPGSPVGLLAVRDSKRTTGPALLFTSTSWRTFVNSLR